MNCKSVGVKTKYAVMITISAVFLLGSVAAFGQKKTTGLEDQPVMGEFKFQGEEIVLQLTEKGGHPKVLVDLAADELFPFIVDTGASVNVMDSAIAEKMAYEVVGETEIGAPGGTQIPGKIVRVPLLRVGDATITNAEFVTMDIDGFSMGTMQGVLGLRLFEDYLLSFDLSQGAITVSKAELSPGATGVMSYAAGSDKIRLDVDVEGTIVPSHIDTGSMGDFLLPIEIIDSLPLKEAPKTGAQARLVGGARDISFAQLDGSIHFAGMQFEHPNLVFMDPSPGAGNIGSGVFGELVMAIDQQNHLISFTRPEGRNVIDGNHKPRRLGLGFRGVPGGSEWIVSVVSPDSLASNAGIQAGDKLISLNGVAAEEYTMTKFGPLFKSSTPLEFVFERDGVQQTNHIQ